MNKLLRILKDVFIRRWFYQHDYFCQTNTYKECWLAIKAFFSRVDYIRGYEERAAEVMGAKWAKSFATGRHALYTILKSLNIGEGDEVICQAFTCVVVPNSILYAGASPIYADINLDTFNMDCDRVREKTTEKTKAVIVQHTFGNIADVEKIRGEINNYNAQKIKKIHAGGGYTLEETAVLMSMYTQKIYIIEDFAHAVGCGKLKGDAGFYSSDHTKMISTGTGGMAFTNNYEIIRDITKQNIDGSISGHSFFRRLQILFTFIVEVAITHPRVYWLLRPLRIFLDKSRLFYFYRDENKREKPKNYPMKLCNFQAAIGLSQLEGLGKQIEERRLYSVRGIMLRDVYLFNEEKNKEMFIKYFNKYYVVGYWFNSPVFGCKDFSRVHYKEGDCPVAEGVCKQIVNLSTDCKSIYINKEGVIKWNKYILKKRTMGTMC